MWLEKLFLIMAANEALYDEYTHRSSHGPDLATEMAPSSEMSMRSRSACTVLNREDLGRPRGRLQSPGPSVTRKLQMSELSGIWAIWPRRVQHRLLTINMSANSEHWRTLYSNMTCALFVFQVCNKMAACLPLLGISSFYIAIVYLVGWWEIERRFRGIAS